MADAGGALLLVAIIAGAGGAIAVAVGMILGGRLDARLEAGQEREEDEPGER